MPALFQKTNNVIPRLSAVLREAVPCGRNSVGQQEIHEREALRGDFERRLYCWQTSFSLSLQINLRMILDSTFYNDLCPALQNVKIEICRPEL